MSAAALILRRKWNSGLLAVILISCVPCMTSRQLEMIKQNKHYFIIISYLIFDRSPDYHPVTGIRRQSGAVTDGG